MYLIIDIGGTKTLIALFNKRGRVLRKFKFKTPEKKSEFLGLLKSALVPFSMAFREKVEQIVIAVPGEIKDNIAVKFGNRPWKNLDFSQELKNLFNAKVTLKNDADLATVYESSFHKGLTLYLTFSTGIGGGLARSGKLAKNSASVEPGHTYYIYDNKSAEWEDIASCNAIGTHYGCQATSVRGKAAYSDIARRVALGLPELIQKYRPDVIVIGGPLAMQFPHFKKELRPLVRSKLPVSRKLPRFVPARRPNEAVIYGGLYYAKKH
ncbi:ROK family protein [Candidatus Saccharibacteria bacterium]|nr:ROK family protein [Candidatus Saccharibacteria bacterium]